MGAVLVIEDDHDIRTEVAELLAEAGYRVLTAADGKEGLDRLSDASDCSLILLDLMMPKLDGWAFRARQLASPELAKIPVVVLSGAGNVKHVTRALRADEVIEKPFGVDELLAVVERFCAPRGSDASSPLCS